MSECLICVIFLFVGCVDRYAWHSIGFGGCDAIPCFSRASHAKCAAQSKSGIVNDLDDTQQWDAHEETEQASTVGKEIGWTIQLRTFRCDELMFFEENWQTSRLHSGNDLITFSMSELSMKCRNFAYPGNSVRLLLKAVNRLTQSNLACDISASYVIDVHDGKQLQPRFTCSMSSAKPSVNSFSDNLSSASL